MTGRKLKKKIKELLGRDDFDNALEIICSFPARQVVNPLFSFFYSKDELTKWRSITAMGAVVSKLADKNMESARIIMRRLMWNLNDESGGIGWGSPEAMGEIMARHGSLAKEYHKILISYIMPDGNFIEHEMLQRGVLWGIGRLAHARPDLIKNSVDLLIPYMKSPDSELRGLAVWTAGMFNSKDLKSLIELLKKDDSIFKFYYKGKMEVIKVSKLAGENHE
ncbi:HEAT repeat domain-containing protein [Candidatus Magnetomoraceae bacterium gMMP-13]